MRGESEGPPKHAEAGHTTPSTRRPRSARAGVRGGTEFSVSVFATPNEVDGHTTGAYEPVPTRVHRRPRSGEGRAGVRSGTSRRGGRHETRGWEAPPVAVIDEPAVTGYGNQKRDPHSDEGHTREDETGDEQISNDEQPSIERQMSPVSSLRGGADMLRSVSGSGAPNPTGDADAPDHTEVERNPVSRRAGPTRRPGTANASRLSSHKATTEAPRDVNGAGSHKNARSNRTRQISRRAGTDEPGEGLHTGKSKRAKAPSEADFEQDSVNGRAEVTRRRQEHKRITHDPTKRASGRPASERYERRSELEPEVIDLDGSDNEVASRQETADTRGESATESESSAETTTGSPGPDTEADDDLSSGPESSRNPTRKNYLGAEIVDVDEMTGSEGEALTKGPPAPPRAAPPSRRIGEVAKGVHERASLQEEAGSKAASARSVPSETGGGGGDEIALEVGVAPVTESQTRTEAVPTHAGLDQHATAAGDKGAAVEGETRPVATPVWSARETADEGAAEQLQDGAGQSEMGIKRVNKGREDIAPSEKQLSDIGRTGVGADTPLKYSGQKPIDETNVGPELTAARQGDAAVDTESRRRLVGVGTSAESGATEQTGGAHHLKVDTPAPSESGREGTGGEVAAGNSGKTRDREAEADQGSKQARNGPELGQAVAGVQRPLKRTIRSFENATLMSLRNKVLMSVKKHKNVGQNKGEHAKSSATSAIQVAGSAPTGEETAPKSSSAIAPSARVNRRVDNTTALEREEAAKPREPVDLPEQIARAAGDEEAPRAHQVLKDRRAEDMQVFEQEPVERSPEPTNLPDKDAETGSRAGSQREDWVTPEKAQGSLRGLTSVDSGEDDVHDGAGSSASRVEIGRKRPSTDVGELHDRLPALRASAAPRRKKPNVGVTAGTAANADTPMSASEGEIEESTARKERQAVMNYVTDSGEDDKFEPEHERGKLSRAEAPKGFPPTNARSVATQTPIRKIAETQVQTTILPRHASGCTGRIPESHERIQIDGSTVTADRHVQVPKIERSDLGVQAKLSEPERAGDSQHDVDRTHPVNTRAEVLRLIETCRRAPLFWGQSLRELRDKVEEGERHLASVKDEVARWEESAVEETRRISAALESLQRLLDPGSEAAGAPLSEPRHEGAPLATWAREGTVDSLAGDATDAGLPPRIAPVVAAPKSRASLPDNYSAEEMAMEVDIGLSGPTLGVDDTNNGGDNAVGAELTIVDPARDPAVLVQSAKPAGHVELDRSAPKPGTTHGAPEVSAQEQGRASREPRGGSPQPATTSDIAASDDRLRIKGRRSEGEAVSLRGTGPTDFGTPPAREAEELVSDSDEEVNKGIREKDGPCIQRRSAEKTLANAGEAPAGTPSGSVRPDAVEQSAGYVQGPEAAASVADVAFSREAGEKNRPGNETVRRGPQVPDAVDGLAWPMSLEVPSQASEVRREPADQQAKDGVAVEESRSLMSSKEQQSKEQPSIKTSRAHAPRPPQLEHDLSSEAELQPDANHTGTFGGETDGDEDFPAIEITDAEKMHGIPFLDVMDEPLGDVGEGTRTTRRLIASDTDQEDAPADRVIRRDEVGPDTAAAVARPHADLQIGAVRSNVTHPNAELPSAAASAGPPAPEIDRVNSNKGTNAPAGKHQQIEGGLSAALPPLPLEAQVRATAPENVRQSPQETAVLSADIATTETPSTSVTNRARRDYEKVDLSRTDTVADAGPGTVVASEPLPKTAQTGSVEPFAPPEAGQDRPMQLDVTAVEEVAPTDRAALVPNTGTPQSSPSAHVHGPVYRSDPAPAATPSLANLEAPATALEAGTGTDAAAAGPKVLRSASMELPRAKDGHAPAALAERVRPEEAKGLNSSLMTSSAGGAPPASVGGESTGQHDEKSSGVRSASDGSRGPEGPGEPTEPSLVRSTGPTTVQTAARTPKTSAKGGTVAGGGRVPSTLLSSSRAYRLKAFATNHAEVVELRDNFVDPTKTFCYWDLRGTCNNKACQYQHFRDLKISPSNLLDEVLCYCPESCYDAESKKLRGRLEAGEDSAVVLQQALKLCGFEKDELPTRLRKRPTKPIHAASDYQGAPQAHARNVG